MKTFQIHFTDGKVDMMEAESWASDDHILHFYTKNKSVAHFALNQISSWLEQKSQYEDYRIGPLDPRD